MARQRRFSRRSLNESNPSSPKPTNNNDKPEVFTFETAFRMSQLHSNSPPMVCSSCCVSTSTCLSLYNTHRMSDFNFSINLNCKISHNVWKISSVRIWKCLDLLKFVVWFQVTIPITPSPIAASSCSPITATSSSPITATISDQPSTRNSKDSCYVNIKPFMFPLPPLPPDMPPNSEDGSHSFVSGKTLRIYLYCRYLMSWNLSIFCETFKVGV